MTIFEILKTMSDKELADVLVDLTNYSKKKPRFKRDTTRKILDMYNDNIDLVRNILYHEATLRFVKAHLGEEKHETKALA